MTPLASTSCSDAVRSDYLPFGKPNFSEEEIAAVTRVMRNGWVGMGPETIAFENELAEYLGAKHVVTVSSCTAAMFLALLASGVGPGDEVICPSLTWCSTANVALYLSARPVFCDIDPTSLCITPEHVVAKLTDKTRAVMVVHLGGLAADVEAIRSVLPKNVTLIEDAAHALGAQYKDGARVGSAGNLTCFSFYANKNLSTAEGGAVALNDATTSDIIRSLRQHGLNVDAWKRFTHAKTILMSPLTELGYKMNYTDLQASIGRVQLRRQQEFHAVRLRIAQRYYDRLSDRNPAVRFQIGSLHPSHARHLLMVDLPVGQMRLKRDELLTELRARNIGATVHYSPLHTMPLYCRDGERPHSLPNTESICKRILTLPISSSMSVEDADYVIGHVEKLIYS